MLALVQQYEQRVLTLQRQVDHLQQRLNQNSTNSSRPPSSDPPHVKRRPPKWLPVESEEGSRGTHTSCGTRCRSSRSSKPSRPGPRLAGSAPRP